MTGRQTPHHSLASSYHFGAAAVSDQGCRRREDIAHKATDIAHKATEIPSSVGALGISTCWGVLVYTRFQ